MAEIRGKQEVEYPCRLKNKTL